MRWSLTGLRGPGSSMVVDWSRANLYTCADTGRQAGVNTKQGNGCRGGALIGKFHEWYR